MRANLPISPLFLHIFREPLAVSSFGETQGKLTPNNSLTAFDKLAAYKTLLYSLSTTPLANTPYAFIRATLMWSLSAGLHPSFHSNIRLSKITPWMKPNCMHERRQSRFRKIRRLLFSYKATPASPEITSSPSSNHVDFHLLRRKSRPIPVVPRNLVRSADRNVFGAIPMTHSQRQRVSVCRNYRTDFRRCSCSPQVYTDRLSRSQVPSRERHKPPNSI